MNDTTPWPWGDFWSLPPAYAGLIIASAVLLAVTVWFVVHTEIANRRWERQQRSACPVSITEAMEVGEPDPDAIVVWAPSVTTRAVASARPEG